MSKTQTIYTPAVIAAMVAASPLNQEKCEQLADQMNAEHGTEAYTPRGFIAKARTVEGVEYIKAETRVTKRGEPVMRKPELVTQICEALDIPEMESLTKAGKSDLQALLKGVQAFISVNA